MSQASPSRSIRVLAGAALFAFLTAPRPAGAASLNPDEKPLVVPKAAQPPVLDGSLDEPAWTRALKVDAFKTFKPDFGKDASQKTEAFVTYDAENFYFAFRCYDSEPDKVKAAMSKRDNIFLDDIVFINVDTFNDNQSAFVFMLNPLGIQGDGMLTVAGNVETSFDAIWYSKGRIDDQGWAVEARIPLQSLRFPNKDVLTWRILFIRFFTRTSEQVSLPPLDPAQGSLLSQAMPLQLSGLKYKRVVELLPALTYGRTYQASEGELRRNPELDIDDFSLTGKVGLTSDLTLDGTLNPDFSQVEADAGQIDFNQRYALYYEEKRPFFLEGSELWQFGGAMEEAPLSALVYTRTIIDPVYGFKLTGKVTPRDTIATILAADNMPGDPYDEHPVFSIARYKHTLKDDAYLGGFYTGREYGAGFNRVGGIDGRLRLSPTSIASFHLFGSFTKAPGDGATRNDHALSLAYEFSDRTWVVNAGYQDISEGFQVDSGFVYRTGLRRLAAFAMYQIYPKSDFFQKIEPFYWSYHLYDTIYNKWETVNVFVLRFRLPRSTMVRFDGLLANEVFSGSLFDLSGFGIQAQSQLAKQLFLFLFARRTGSTYYDPGAPFQGYGTRLMSELQYQPTDQLDFGLSLSYVDFYRKSDKAKIYDYLILRSRNNFQVNKYLFLRGIVEYNDFYERVTLDGLVSFTYIPGTVVHLGYGSALERLEWLNDRYAASERFHQTARGFFFKVSYNWRL